ncbi:MAG: hypothetical protein SGI72_12675 [Planctomycetota bacterium]|nr:hypothetical protein [Planctomycetota bacterium]
MAEAKRPDSEPQAKAELLPFDDGDFHCLSPSLARDPQYNDRRLVLRRKLLSLAKVFAPEAQALGVEFDVRTSLHSPSSFNGMQVKRIWAYAVRAKSEKKRLKSVLGADLAKDLDASYRNAYVCAAVENDALEVSLRIHADAWFDGANLVNRVKREGFDGWKKQLNALDGYRLRLADWKGEWPCGALGSEKLAEFLKYYKPAEHALVVERRWPATPGLRAALFEPHVPREIVGEMLRLVPLYRFTAWSAESDFLFSK